MGWSYLLCAWLYLPRAQPLLPSVHSWRFSDTSSDTTAVNDDTSAVNDNDDYDTSIDDNADNHFNERVQAFLRAELRQLVVQMLMGLLQRVFAMHGSPSNDYYNNPGDDNHHTSLQALVFNKHTALDNKVRKEKVFWLCGVFATWKAPCCHNAAVGR